MRHIKELIFTLILISVCSSCVLFIRRNFRDIDQGIRFSTEYTPLVNDKLNFDGYYYDDRPNADIEFSLYPDGTYLGFCFKDSYFKYKGKSVTDLTSLIWLSDKNEPSYYGGIYQIVGNTLFIHRYRRDFSLCWHLTIEQYEIIDRNTLRLNRMFFISKYAGQRSTECNQIYRFVKASPLPSPFEAKVKSEKWMWDNKEEWKAYKQELQEYLDSKVTQNNTDE